MTDHQNAYVGPTNWAQAPRSTVGGQAAGGGSNGWDMDLKPLKQLETHLQNIVNLFGQLDTKIKTATTGLKGMGVPGAAAGAAGGSSLSTAAVTAITSTGQTAATAAKMGGQNVFSPGSGGSPSKTTPGPGGPNNTSAGFGGVGTALGMVAGVGALSQGAGWLSGKLSGMQAGGVPVDLAAAQQATISGGSSASVVGAWNGIMKTSQADMSQAQNMALQNPYMTTARNPNSKNFKNYVGLMNSTQKLGNISAASAQGFLNDLTSNQAQHFFGAITGGKGGVFDPRTGKLRSPQQALLSTLQAGTGTIGFSGNRLSAALKHDASTPGQWAAADQNFAQAGMSSSDMVLMQELAAQGGKLSKAQDGQLSKSQAMQLLSQTTQSTNTQNTMFQDTKGLQTAFSKLETSASHLEQMFTNIVNGQGRGLLGGLTHMIPGVSSALDMASKIPVVGGLLSGLGLGDPDTTSGMQPNLAHGITAMKRANPRLQINSGHRSQSQQAALYAMKGGQGVARPGQSPHQLGKAADIGPASQYGWLAANAQKFGLATDKHEPWHVQVGDPGTASSVTGAQVVSTASTQLGVNYVWGGETAGKAFDCSGLVQYVFGQLGISLPRTTYEQVKCGSPVASLAKAQAGDLLFYEGPATAPNHVAIYIGAGKQIAAPHTGTKVQVQSVTANAIVAIRRVISGGGGKAVSVAQSTVGMTSNDSTSGGGGTTGTGTGAGAAGAPGGLSNTFIGGLSGSWLSGGGTGGGMAAAHSPTSSAGSASTSSASASPSSSASASTTPASAGAISPAAVQAAWIKAGGPPNIASTMAGIAMAESGDQPGIVQKGQPYATTGWGLWQITPGDSDPQIGKDQQLLDPVTNAKVALAKYQGAGNTLRPWAGDHYLEQNHINPASSGVGDPTGGFTPNTGPQSYGGPGPVSAMSSGGGRGVSVSVGPIYVQGSQADANNIANMVASAIKGHREIQAVAKS